MIGGAVIVAAVITAALIFSSRIAAPRNPNPHIEKSNHLSKKKTTLPVQPVAVFDKSKFSQTDPSSIWVVVNKQHKLNPPDFVPPVIENVGGVLVSKVAAGQLELLIAGAKNNGISLRVISGYRSYGYQETLYNSYVRKDGQTLADTYSARPGHSEHQTGLAVDFGGANGCDLEVCFGNTPEGSWLRENAATYGFIVRYTADNQTITGYSPEPWHLRYVGPELALEMKKQKISSLEEFFDVSGGNTYAQ